MITPDVFIESFESYRTGDIDFCKLASISNKNDGIKKYFGFWIEVVRNDRKLVLLIQFESLANSEPAQTMVFFGKKHMEDFIEDARLCASNELGKMVCQVLHPIES